MPNVRIQNTVANVGIRESRANVRVEQSGGLSPQETTLIQAGQPIGLLLALTYAGNIMSEARYFGDLRPHVNIRTT